MTYPFGETVQLLDGDAVTQDNDGNDTRTFPVKATFTGVPVAPADANGTGGNEYVDARDTVIIGLSVYLPDSAEVKATDRMLVRGDTWEIVGLPQPWLSPFTGWRPGMAVALRRARG